MKRGMVDNPFERIEEEEEKGGNRAKRMEVMSLEKVNNRNVVMMHGHGYAYPRPDDITADLHSLQTIIAKLTINLNYTL